MGKTVKIDDLAEEVMKGLTEYSKLATADMKKAVKKAGNDVRKEIQSTAPKETGAYAKSWAVKTTRESAEKQISACSSFGIRTRKAWRWKNQSPAAYRTCRRKRHQRT